MAKPLSPRLPDLRASAAAYTVPFVVFLLLLEGIRFVRVDNSLLPWWRQFPEHWGYPLQAIVCLALLLWWYRRYPAPAWRGAGLATAMGIAGIAVWLLPPVLHAISGIGERSPFLALLGFQARLEGFDPGAVVDEGTPAFLPAAILAMRFLRLVVVVPLVEEFFWRGFLMRFLSDRSVDWRDLPLEQCDGRGIWLTALAFAAAHWGPDFFVALVFGLLVGWVVRRTGNLWAAVLMHAVANLSLGLFILASGWWGLW